MNVKRAWHLMCNHKNKRVRVKNHKRYVKWLLASAEGRNKGQWRIRG